MFKLFVWWKAPGYRGDTRHDIESKPTRANVDSIDEAIVELRQLVKARANGLIVFDEATVYTVDPTGMTGDFVTSWAGELPAAPSKPATEPTFAGLQYVMPGCEKDQTRGPAQMSLF